MALKYEVDINGTEVDTNVTYDENNQDKDTLWKQGDQNRSSAFTSDSNHGSSIESGSGHQWVLGDTSTEGNEYGSTLDELKLEHLTEENDANIWLSNLGGQNEIKSENNEENLKDSKEGIFINFSESKEQEHLLVKGEAGCTDYVDVKVKQEPTENLSQDVPAPGYFFSFWPHWTSEKDSIAESVTVTYSNPTKTEQAEMWCAHCHINFNSITEHLAVCINKKPQTEDDDPPPAGPTPNLNVDCPSANKKGPVIRPNVPVHYIACLPWIPSGGLNEDHHNHIYVYKCVLCSKRFGCYSHYKRHIQRSAIRKRRCWCCHCGDNFASYTLLEFHIGNSHEEIPVVAQHFSGISGVLAHTVSDQPATLPGIKTECELCDGVFHSKEAYVGHFITDGKSNSSSQYTCCRCKVVSESVDSFLGHCKLLHDKVMLEFEKHLVSKTRVEQIEEDMDVSEKPSKSMPYCKMCSCGFFSYVQYFRHFIDQSNWKKRIRCCTCQTTYSVPSAFERHCQLVHGFFDVIPDLHIKCWMQVYGNLWIS